MQDQDLYVGLLHEVKNNLVVLAMTLDTAPRNGDPVHDEPLDQVRLMVQRVSERLLQALLIYKNEIGALTLNAVDAYSPADLLDEVAMHARSFSKELEVTVAAAEEVPPIWFYDRNMIEMALVNAVHNSIGYARKKIEIEARIRDGMLVISVRDDSDGYPAHILAAVETGAALQSAGTGLGLRFARLIAEAHVNEGRHGALRLYNDRGAVFEISVP